MSKPDKTPLRYAIGDVHGRSYWKSFIYDDYTEFYFVGDFFDSHTIPFHEQYRNFTEICNAAREDSRIKLCLGNHDYHYLQNIIDQRYSGFQDNYSRKISAVLEDNIDLLKIVYTTNDKIIISHAGVTEWFLKSINGKIPEDINHAFDDDRNILCFNGLDIYGNDITQSPIWVRPESLEKNPLPGYSQIVGHTVIGKITERELKGGGKFVFIDTGNIKSIYRF